MAIIQARMSSQRLPGKVLATLPTRTHPALTVVDWTVQRVRQAENVHQVVLATSTEPSDDPLAEHCSNQDIEIHRGSLEDVLDRFHSAARSAAADVVVRVTGDCPLIDPAVVDLVISAHLEGAARFTANRLPPPHARTFPVGLDVEVTDFAYLDEAWREARRPHQREHVMPYLYEDRPDGVLVVDGPVEAGDVRWTVDTAEDLQAVRRLVRLADADVRTSWLEFLEFWRSDPGLANLNRHVSQRTATDVDPRLGGGK